MRKLLVQTLFVFVSIQISNAQPLRTVSRLPANLDECSGIEVSSSNKIWALNDGGGKSELYLCDTTGQLIKTVTITGAQNQDWEDLAQDDQGNFFIGDMGNNDNDRKNLRIYIIPNPDVAKDDSVQAELISFSFEDQYSFPPPNDSLNYDCEAIVWYNHHIYLFSKHRTLPMSTNLYKIPDTPGVYLAKKIGSFQNGKDNDTNVFGLWITSADISPDGAKVSLLSQDKMWVLYDYVGDDFFSGKVRQIDFPPNTQKESICFVDESTLYITDEEWPGDIGRRIYTINISNLLTSEKRPPAISEQFSVFPNPCRDFVNVEGPLENRKIEIYDIKGSLLKSLLSTSSKMQVETRNYPKGTYHIKLRDTSSGKIVFSTLVEKI